jgi:hypothetical protein
VRSSPTVHCASRAPLSARTRATSAAVMSPPELLKLVRMYDPTAAIHSSSCSRMGGMTST